MFQISNKAINQPLMPFIAADGHYTLAQVSKVTLLAVGQFLSQIERGNKICAFIKKREAGLVHILIASGLSSFGDRGGEAVIQAARRNHKEKVQLFLKAGVVPTKYKMAAISDCGTYDCERPLRVSWSFSREIILLLLADGDVIDKQTLNYVVNKASRMDDIELMQRVYLLDPDPFISAEDRIELYNRLRRECQFEAAWLIIRASESKISY